MLNADKQVMFSSYGTRTDISEVVRLNACLYEQVLKFSKGSSVEEYIIASIRDKIKQDYLNGAKDV